MSNLANELGHLKNHVTYPADRKTVIAACNNMYDVPEDDRTWFEKNLPEGNYRSAREVIGALLEKV